MFLFYFYLQTKKISKIFGSEPLSKRFKLVIAEEMINTYNLEGSNGKKSLRSHIGFYGVLKGKYTNKQIKRISKHMPLHFFRSVGQGLRGPGQMFAMTNVKNKLTKQKNRNNNSQICENLNNTV